jgi:hypothetical protein
LLGGSVLNIDGLYVTEPAPKKFKRTKKYYSVKIVSQNYRQYGHFRYFNNGDCYQRICHVHKGKKFVTYRKKNGPYTRMFVPDLIINDCVGIAPITAPSGEVFSLKANFFQELSDAAQVKSIGPDWGIREITEGETIHGLDAETEIAELVAQDIISEIQDIHDPGIWRPVR